jgi:hypothetical protein
LKFKFPDHHPDKSDVEVIMKTVLMIILLAVGTANAQEEVKEDNNFKKFVTVGYLMAPTYKVSGTAYVGLSSLASEAEYKMKDSLSIGFEMSRQKVNAFNLGFRLEYTSLDMKDYTAKVGTVRGSGNADGSFKILSAMFAPNIRIGDGYFTANAGLTAGSYSGNDSLLKAATPFGVVGVGGGYHISEKFLVEGKLKYHLISQKSFTESGVTITPDSNSVLTTTGGLELMLKFGF